MKTRLYLVALLAFACGTAGCGKGDAQVSDPVPVKRNPGASVQTQVDPEITIKTLLYAFDGTPSEAGYIGFEVNTNWAVAVEYDQDQADWLTVSPESGLAGQHALTLRAEDNPDSTARKAFVRIAYGDREQRVSVSQEAVQKSADSDPEEGTDPSPKPDPKLELHTPSAYECFYAHEAYEEKIAFSVNTDWTVAIEYLTECGEWLAVNPMSGEAGEIELTMLVPQNPAKERRMAHIEIFYGDKGWYEVIGVQQYGVNLAHIFEPEFARALERRGYVRDARQIYPEEVKGIKSLQLHGNWDASQEIYLGKITSLKGIEYFESLEDLTCWGNQITSLDLSKNKALKEVMCYSNKLESIDVSGCPELRTLYCRENRLTTIDVSRNANLSQFSCGENLLSKIDVSCNSNLTSLLCEGNPLSSLDLGSNPLLKALFCSNTGMTSLDISNNPQVSHVQCYNNPGDGEFFPIYAWFDNETIPQTVKNPDERTPIMWFPTKSWTFDGRTITPDYRKVK